MYDLDRLSSARHEITNLCASGARVGSSGGMALLAKLKALLSLSAYQPPAISTGLELDSAAVKAARAANGGQLALQPVSETRWYLEDVEVAEHAADTGQLGRAGQLMRSAIKDGTITGVASTRFGGMVRLPKRFKGDPEIIAALEVGHESIRSVFDEMFPPAELALLARDGDFLGVAVGELVPVQGRDYPVLRRLDPAFLTYRWNENRWYYSSIAGQIPITPGDGQWILHVPGGHQAPWQNGLWRAIARAFIRKEHASLHKDNWEGKLANPARVAVSPAAATDEQEDSWFRAVMAWGVNTVFGMKPGYDVKLIESNGRGWECFIKTIELANQEIIIAVAGQTVTTDGGAGFANADIHKSIRADLIKSTAESLAYTLNTQGIPPFVLARWGEDALERSPVVSWDVTPPRDLAAEATAMVTTAQAITQLTQALKDAGSKSRLDVAALCSRFGVPIEQDGDGDGIPDAKPSLRMVS